MLPIGPLERQINHPASYPLAIPPPRHTPRHVDHGMHFPSGYFSKNYFGGSRVFIPPFFRLFSIFDKKNALFIDTYLTIFNDSLLYAYNIHTSALHLIYIVLSTYIQSLKIIDVICIHQ